MIDKLIPLWLRERSHQSIWIVSAFLIGVCWLRPEIDILIQANSQLTSILLVKVSISLFLVSFSLMASLFIFYRKPNIKNYDLINPPGFLKHRKTGKYYCQPCLLKSHIASELSSIVTENKLVCHCCNKAYNISANLITNSYLSKAYDEAVKEIFLKDKNGQQVNQGDGR